MKPPLLFYILLTVMSTALTAQTLPAPDSIKSTTQLPGAPLPERLAEDAQKALFDAVDANGAVKGAPTKMPGSESPMPGRQFDAPSITTRPDGSTSTTFSRPSMPKLDDPAFWSRDSVHQLAVMELKFGGNSETVIIELFPEDAPQTVANFIDHCESKAYNGLAFHRAIENFLVQTGDPLTADESRREEWGTGGEEATIPSEIKRLHRLGSVAMARRSDKVNPSRRSNGSQFYVSLGNYGAVNGKYTVFGQVVEGIDVLQHISKMPVDSNDCPVARIEVDSIRIVEQKGPLLAKSTAAGKRGFRKPGASKGWFERVLERVW